MKKIPSVLFFFFSFVCAFVGAGPSPAFAEAKNAYWAIKERGSVRCGINPEQHYYSERTENEKWTGLYVDFCEAIAVAMFDSVDAVEYVPVDYADRFESLRKGELDVLTDASGWTLRREVTNDLHFTLPLYFDYQAFLAHEGAGWRTLSDAKDAKVCVVQGHNAQIHATNYIKDKGLKAEIVVYLSWDRALSEFLRKQCDLLASNYVQILYVKENNPGLYFLDDRINSDMTALATRYQDKEWSNFVSWVMYALINAEEAGVSSENIKTFKGEQLQVQRLLKNDIGKIYGLPENWLARAVAKKGNYGEIYRKYFPNQTEEDRGINRPWNKGGLLFAPPF